MANSNNVWLCDAIKSGDVEFARDLLHLGADPYDKNAFRTENPLKLAVKSNNFEMAKLLLKWGYNLNLHEYHHPNTQSAFHDAVEEGKLGLVSLFLKFKAEVNSVNHKNETALHIACQKGHEEVVRLLAEAGSDIERKDSMGWSPLRQACMEGHWNIAKYLVSCGASVDTVSNGEENPLLRSLRKDHSDWEIIEILSRNVNRYGRGEESLLTNEIFQVDINFKLTEIIDILYNYGFKLKVYSITLLELRSMARLFKYNMCEALIHAGIKISISDSFKCKPLLYCATNERFQKLVRDASRHYRKVMRVEIKNEHIQQLFINGAYGVIPPLKHLCRFAIRDSLGYEATTKVTALPLPKSLIEYLQLKSL